MARIFVGNLPTDIKESELDDLFYKYGKIKDIDIKQPARPPAFAFVTFDSSLDAEDAVRGRDGYNYDGYRLRCEFARGDRGDRGERGGRDFRENDRRRGGGRRTEFGVVVTNLPRRCSWQDLKDFMRKIGDVVYADVDKYKGEGVVEFSNREDMDKAIKDLDDSEFKNYDDTTFIRVKPAKKRDRSEDSRRDRRDRSHSSARDRSRSRERKRSPSRSPSPNVSSNGRKDDRRDRDRDREDDRRRDDREEEDR